MAKKPPSAEKLVRDSLKFEYFYPQEDDNGDTPIPVTFLPGTGRLVLAIGGNASGKSFYRRVVQAVCKLKGDIECIHLSMEGRRSSSYAGFIYGDENYHSTGQNSAYTVITALETSKLRETPHVIFWDEPDFGLSESWSESMGVEIYRGLTTDPSPNLVAAFLVTHSRPLLKPLLGLNPHTLIFDENAPTSLQEYLDRPVSIQPLSLLKALSYQRFQKIQKILNRVKRHR